MERANRVDGMGKTLDFPGRPGPPAPRRHAPLAPGRGIPGGHRDGGARGRRGGGAGPGGGDGRRGRARGNAGGFAVRHPGRGTGGDTGLRCVPRVVRPFPAGGRPLSPLPFRPLLWEHHAPARVARDGRAGVPPGRARHVTPRPVTRRVRPEAVGAVRRRRVPRLGNGSAIESPITVAGRGGNAPSALRVGADITHTHRGDLVVDPVAPDGSACRLKSASSSDSADDARATCTVNASAEVADGTWKLRLRTRRRRTAAGSAPGNRPSGGSGAARRPGRRRERLVRRSPSADRPAGAEGAPAGPPSWCPGLFLDTGRAVFF